MLKVNIYLFFLHFAHISGPPKQGNQIGTSSASGNAKVIATVTLQQTPSPSPHPVV